MVCIMERFPLLKLVPPLSRTRRNRIRRHQIKNAG
ncbi:unnamed protein product [Linum tenue]|uniref:Uncharacterized protein n=1 Tax=Linum tenue TaxID=586396 RepID=A0AAV0KWT6_9ROSI|nr:unnamed protein product [Linum tenue]CAI0426281.1 unnamed protein product [Linum tenue]